MKTLFTRMVEASRGLEPEPTDLCVAFETFEGNLTVLKPNAMWMAMALKGGILPPVEVYHQLECEWHNAAGEVRVTGINESPGAGWKGGRVLNNHILHETPPIGPLTEEGAIEYLIQKDVPQYVWSTPSNRPRLAVIKKDQLPKNRAFRDAWTINKEL